MAEEGGVVIGDGRCRVRLSRVRPPHEGIYSTIVDVRAGPFGGSVSDDMSFLGFCEQLDALHKNLNGVVQRGSYEKFQLRFVGDGKGAIQVEAELVAEHLPLIMLKFEFSIDQSYLPEIIRQLEIEFPSA